MPLPPKVQEEREKLAKRVVEDIRSGKPFFWDSGHYNRSHRNLIADLAQALTGETPDTAQAVEAPAYKTFIKYSFQFLFRYFLQKFLNPLRLSTALPDLYDQCRRPEQLELQGRPKFL